MILTTCAACAAPLALDAPRCIRCRTRYCDWKTYVGRPEADLAYKSAMQVLGHGLSDAKRHAEALGVFEAQFAIDKWTEKLRHLRAASVGNSA